MCRARLARAEWPQKSKRNDPLPSFLETSRVDGVKAPQDAEVAPQEDGLKLIHSRVGEEQRGVLNGTTGEDLTKAWSRLLSK